MCKVEQSSENCNQYGTRQYYLLIDELPETRYLLYCWLSILTWWKLLWNRFGKRWWGCLKVLESPPPAPKKVATLLVSLTVYVYRVNGRWLINMCLLTRLITRRASSSRLPHHDPSVVVVDKNIWKRDSWCVCVTVSLTVDVSMQNGKAGLGAYT